MVSATRSVLVLTHPFDPTADKVAEELNNRDVAVFRVDAADFPERLSARAELIGEVETAHAAWSDLGEPPRERFGITATQTECYVWFEHPESQHRWPLD